MVTTPEGKKAFSVTIGNNLRMISALSEMKVNKTLLKATSYLTILL